MITRAVYRANGNPGYVETDTAQPTSSRSPCPTAPPTSLKPKQITDGEFDERDIAWAPDGSKIYFTSTRVAEPYYDPSDSDLYSVPATGGSITKVASIDGTIDDVSVSPDGKRLAFIGTLRGTPVRSYSQPDLWVVDAVPGATPKNLTAAYDFDVSGGIGGDQAAPRGRNGTADRLVDGRLVADRRLRRARQREPEARHDRDRQDRSAHRRPAGDRRLQRDA